MIVKKPMLVPQNRWLDFGYGFYTTSNLSQAQSFAMKVSFRRGGTPVVNEYEFDLTAVEKKLTIRRFINAGEEWLDFVSANRNGSYSGEKYDVIIGPVANDDVYRTFQLYMSGELTREQTVDRLKVKRLFDQYVFTSEKSLEYINFIKSETI